MCAPIIQTCGPFDCVDPPVRLETDAPFQEDSLDRPLQFTVDCLPYRYVQGLLKSESDVYENFGVSSKVSTLPLDQRS